MTDDERLQIITAMQSCGQGINQQQRRPIEAPIPSTFAHLHVLSDEAVMTRVPCGLNETLLISPSCPMSVCMQTQDRLLYTRAVPSALALTNFSPVESNETSRTYERDAHKRTARSHTINLPQTLSPRPALASCKVRSCAPSNGHAALPPPFLAPRPRGPSSPRGCCRSSRPTAVRCSLLTR